MAKIRVFNGGTFRSEFDLDVGAEFTAGSSLDSSIVVADPRVSDCHCRFAQVNGAWVVEDRDTALGTFVNDRKISVQPLEHKDRIAVGTYTLVFERGAEIAAAAPRELTLESMDLDETPPAPDHEPGSNPGNGGDPGSERGGRPMVLVLEQPRRGAVPLERKATLIGKAPHCDIRVAGWFVKAEQAVVLREGGSCRIICQGGLRPVRVNGDPVREMLLQTGDVITIAGSRFRFQVL